MNYALMTQTQNLLTPRFGVDSSRVRNYYRKESKQVLDEQGIPIDPNYSTHHIREHFVDTRRWPGENKGSFGRSELIDELTVVYIFKDGKLFKRPSFQSAKAMFGVGIYNRLTGRIKNQLYYWVMYERDYKKATILDNGMTVPIEY